jgi:hypothetical protein
MMQAGTRCFWQLALQLYDFLAHVQAQGVAFLANARSANAGARGFGGWDF